MPGQVEKGVDLCDGHPLRRRGNPEDFVPGLHLAFYYDAHVETGTVV